MTSFNTLRVSNREYEQLEERKMRHIGYIAQISSVILLLCIAFPYPLLGQDVVEFSSGVNILERIKEIYWDPLNGLRQDDLDLLLHTIETDERYPIPFEAAKVLANFSWDSKVREAVEVRSAENILPLDRRIYFLCLKLGFACVSDAKSLSKRILIDPGQVDASLRPQFLSARILAIGLAARNSVCVKELFLEQLGEDLSSSELFLATQSLGNDAAWFFPIVLDRLHQEGLDSRKSAEKAVRLVALLQSGTRYPPGTTAELVRVFRSETVLANEKTDILSLIFETNTLDAVERNRLISIALERTDSDSKEGMQIRLLVLQRIFQMHHQERALEGLVYWQLGSKPDEVFDTVDALVEGLIHKADRL